MPCLIPTPTLPNTHPNPPKGRELEMLCTVAHKAYQAHPSHWAYPFVLQKMPNRIVKGR